MEDSVGLGREGRSPAGIMCTFNARSSSRLVGERGGRGTWIYGAVNPAVTPSELETPTRPQHHLNYTAPKKSPNPSSMATPG